MDAGLDEAIIAGLLDADVHLLNHAVFAGGEGLCNNVTFVQQEHLVATCFFNEAVVIKLSRSRCCSEVRSLRLGSNSTDQESSSCEDVKLLKFHDIEVFEFRE